MNHTAETWTVSVHPFATQTLECRIGPKHSLAQGMSKVVAT